MLKFIPVLSGMAVICSDPCNDLPLDTWGRVFLIREFPGHQKGVIIEPLPDSDLLVCDQWRCRLHSLDINDNGFVEGSDLDTFLEYFTVGSILADYNGDSFVNGLDLDSYRSDFLLGE